MPPGRIQTLGSRLAHADGGGLEHFRQLGLARFHGLPECVVNDAQLGHFGPNPLHFGIAPRDPPTRAGVLDEPLPVPDQAANVELIVEDAVVPAGVTAEPLLTPSGNSPEGG